MCVRSACWGQHLWEVATVWGRSYFSPGELILGYGSLSRVKLLRLTARCGRQPLPAFSLVTAVTPQVRTVVASCLLPLDLILIFLLLESETEVTGSTCGSHKGMVLCSVRAGTEKFLTTMSSCLLAGPGFSLDSLSCVILDTSEYLLGSELWSSPWCLTPKAWTCSPSPHLLWWTHKPFLDRKFYSATISVVNSLHFAFQVHVAAFPSEILKLPLPPMRFFSNVWDLFFLHDPLLRVQITIPKSFVCLFFPLSSALPHSEEFGLPFWKFSISASIQKMYCRSWSAYRWTFYVFACGEMISLPYSSMILKVFSAILLPTLALISNGSIHFSFSLNLYLSQ